MIKALTNAMLQLFFLTTLALACSADVAETSIIHVSLSQNFGNVPSLSTVQIFVQIRTK